MCAIVFQFTRELMDNIHLHSLRGELLLALCAVLVAVNSSFFQLLIENVIFNLVFSFAKWRAERAMRIPRENRQKSENKFTRIAIFRPRFLLPPRC